MRIVSLLPSATEIVCALGLSEALVGVTHECDYPPIARAKPIVTHSLLDHSASTSEEIDHAVSDQAEISFPHHLAGDFDGVTRRTSGSLGRAHERSPG